MPQLIKQLANNRSVLFDRGTFDDWCVYVVEKDGKKQAPFDSTYFAELLAISHQYPKGKVYKDFVSIYNQTSKHIDPTVLTLIESIVANYNVLHHSIVEQWFTVLYAGMIAEENKARAILKKRIKHLGVYQVLVLGMQPSAAANFSKGKNWRDLDAIMKSYGF